MEVINSEVARKESNGHFQQLLNKIVFSKLSSQQLHLKAPCEGGWLHQKWGHAEERGLFHSTQESSSKTGHVPTYCASRWSLNPFSLQTPNCSQETPVMRSHACPSLVHH